MEARSGPARRWVCGAPSVRSLHEPPRPPESGSSRATSARSARTRRRAVRRFEARYWPPPTAALADPSLARAGPADRGGRRWGIRRHFQIAPWTDTVEVYWAAHTEAYVTPVADDCVGVAILTSRQGKFDDHLSEFPAWQHDSSGRRGPARAAGPLRQRVPARQRPGHARRRRGRIRRRPHRRGSGYRLRGAELLVKCVLADDPADYTRQWRRMSRRYRLLTAALLHASGFRRCVPGSCRPPSRCPRPSPGLSTCSPFRLGK